MTCQHTSTLGVYLLGALEPEDRSTFESHLYGCDVCRAELVRLAPLPGLLNQIAVTDFEYAGESPARAAESPVAAPEPLVPEELEPPVIVATLPEPVVIDLPVEPDVVADPPRRKRYWQLATAAAVVIVLAVAGVIGYQAMRGGTATSHTVTWSGIDPISGIHADVQLTERSWGTDIKVSMSNVSGNKECRLVVKAKYGYHDKPVLYAETAGWWTSNHRPGEGISGSTSIDLDSIYQLEIMDGEKMLVGIHPA